MNITNFHLTKNFLITSCIILILALTGCGEALNPSGIVCTDWLVEAEDEITAYGEASKLYNEDPSKANCEKKKEALLNYINQLEELRDCVPTGLLVDLEAGIENAQDEINETSCD